MIIMSENNELKFGNEQQNKFYENNKGIIDRILHYSIDESLDIEESIIEVVSNMVMYEDYEIETALQFVMEINQMDYKVLMLSYKIDREKYTTSCLRIKERFNDVFPKCKLKSFIVKESILGSEERYYLEYFNATDESGVIEAYDILDMLWAMKNDTSRMKYFEQEYIFRDFDRNMFRFNFEFLYDVENQI